MSSDNTKEFHEILIGQETVFRDVSLTYKKGANNHTLITGTSGSGKSWLCKKIVKDIGNADDSAYVFVIDPFDDFGQHGNLKEKLHEESLYKHALDVIELDGSSDYIKNQDNLSNRTRFIFKHMKHEKGINMVGCVESIWDKIKNADKDIFKLVVIDEAWLLLHPYEKGVEILKTIITKGRKLNCMLVITMQSFIDLPENIIGNCDTRIALRLRDLDADDGSLIGLDKKNSEILKNVDRGVGVILKSGKQTLVNFN